MADLPPGCGFHNDEHPASENIALGTYMKCHDSNGWRREINPDVPDFDLLERSICDAPLGRSLANQVELAMPRTFKTH